MSKKIRLSFLLFFVSFQSTFSLVDSYINEQSFATLNVLNGLASNEVSCILQDSQGFIWFGTKNGLSRYDSYEFVNYKSNYLRPTFFVGNSITCLIEDNKNRLWVGTTAGLNVFDLKTGSVNHYSCEQIGCGTILSLAITQNNSIYVGTDIALFQYNSITDTFSRLSEDENKVKICGNYIKTLFVDSQNHLWIGTWDSGLSILDGNTNCFIESQDFDRFKQTSITSFFEDKDNNIWLSTWDRDGVYRVKEASNRKSWVLEKFETISFYNENRKPVVYGITQDLLTGNIWMATANGIQILNDTDAKPKITHLNKLNIKHILSEEIYTIFRDRNGLIWFSMYGAGVGYTDLNKEYFNELNLTERMNNGQFISSVTSVFVDDNDMVWVGLRGQVMALYNKKNDAIIKNQDHPVLKQIDGYANTVTCILKHKTKNEVWLGTRYDGIYVVQIKNKVPHSIYHLKFHETIYKNATVTSITEESNGRIWVGTEKGLFALEKDIDEHLAKDWQQKANHFYYNNYITSLLFDNDSHLWVGTLNSGLYYMDIVKNTTIDSPPKYYSLKNNRLNNNEVICLHKDSENTIWVGTNGGGLSFYDKANDKFNVIEKMNLISDDAIYSIVEDENKNLWLSTSNRLVSYNSTLEEERLQVFAQYTGKINSYNINSSFRTNKNELYFGGNNGFISFTPASFRDNEATPTPVITEIIVANKPLGYMTSSKREKISQQLPPFTKGIAVSHKENSIYIEFSSLSYENPAAQKYSYILEGADKAWNVVGSNKRSVSYSNLPKGKYTFKIKAANSKGIWSEQSNDLEIIILPAWWETNLAYLLYILSVALLIFFYIRFSNNKLKLKRRLEIEQIEREKSEEVQQAKLRFFTNVSHELFTPMTILLCSLDDLSKRYPQESKVLHIMKANVNRLMRLLQQIMEFRKVETGNLRLKVTEIDIVEFIRELCEVHFQPFTEQKNIELEFKCSTDEIMGFVDVDKLDKIMFNLLSNAFKYNRENGSVSVTVTEIAEQNDKYLQIFVTDTGKGIRKDVFDNLFKRFYEGDFRKFKVKGTGIGLSLTKDLMDLHHGEITVETKEGIGTTFSLKIPINESAYSSEERDIEIQSNLLKAETKRLVNNDWMLEDSVQLQSDANLAKDAILIVEDNEDLLQVISETLSDEFNVHIAQNGQIALDILKKNNISLVITDVVMPVMDGITLCKEIKKNIEFSHIPIIMLTAKHDTEYKVEGLDAGADVYITKPFEVPFLIANAKSLIRNRKQMRLSFGNIESQSEEGIENYVHNEIDKDFLKKLTSYIEANIFEQNFSTSSIYKEMNMSQATMYRKLQMLIGMSPNELIKNIKIKTACKMLVENKYNVSEIAYDLGFSDPKYFSAIFKKTVGMTPTEFLKSKTK